jgi:hypothetical protein
VHNFRTDALGLKTVADLHVLLREECYLSDKDFKDKSITIRVDLYETESVDPVSSHCVYCCWKCERIPVSGFRRH